MMTREGIIRPTLDPYLLDQVLMQEDFLKPSVNLRPDGSLRIRQSLWVEYQDTSKPAEGECRVYNNELMNKWKQLEHTTNDIVLIPIEMEIRINKNIHKSGDIEQIDLSLNKGLIKLKMCSYVLNSKLGAPPMVEDDEEEDFADFELQDIDTLSEKLADKLLRKPKYTNMQKLICSFMPQGNQKIKANPDII